MDKYRFIIPRRRSLVPIHDHGEKEGFVGPGASRINSLASVVDATDGDFFYFANTHPIYIHSYACFSH